MSLFNQRRFFPFFWTQGLGAFNDNLFKTALITQVAFNAASLNLPNGVSLQSSTLVTLLPGLFILPFFLFSATAGQIADKYEKSLLIRIIKALEICIMLFASVGFFINSIAMLALALFLMGMHSTMFGPVKYAYLPQHLQVHELTTGNGFIEMGTFVSILLGQVLGAWLGSLNQHALFTSLSITLIAFSGYHFCLQIPHSPAPVPDMRIQWNPLIETFQNLKVFFAQKILWRAILAISWFWFFGATLLTQFPNLAKNILHGSEQHFILLLTFFSAGVGIGSVSCNKLSRGLQVPGLVILGGIGMSVFALDFAWVCTQIHHQIENMATPTFDAVSNIDALRMLFDILLLGTSGGVYIVPLYVLLQSRVEATHQSRVIAANNIMNALFMVLSAACTILLFSAGISIPQLFAITALVNIVALLLLCCSQPEYWQSLRQLIHSKNA